MPAVQLLSPEIFAFLQRAQLPRMIPVSNWAWQQQQGKPVPGKRGTPWKDGLGSELSSGPLESKTFQSCFFPPSSFLPPFLSPLLPSFPWGQTSITVSWLPAPLVPAQFSSWVFPLIKYFTRILVLTCLLNLYAGVRFLWDPSWVSIISSVINKYMCSSAVSHLRLKKYGKVGRTQLLHSASWDLTSLFSLLQVVWLGVT